MLSGVDIALRNFSHQGIYRTVGPLLVTSSMMARFTRVGWQSLVILLPNEYGALRTALDVIKPEGKMATFTRAAVLDQAHYKTIAKCAILLAEPVFPTLLALRGKFRAAPLSASVKKWVRHNRDLIHPDPEEPLPTQDIDEFAHLVSMVAAAFPM